MDLEAVTEHAKKFFAANPRQAQDAKGGNQKAYNAAVGALVREMPGVPVNLIDAAVDSALND